MEKQKQSVAGMAQLHWQRSGMPSRVGQFGHTSQNPCQALWRIVLAAWRSGYRRGKIEAARKHAGEREGK